MKLKIKSSTTEELEQELDDNIMDLLGDVLWLHCLLRCKQQDMPIASYCTDEVVYASLQRLSCYINQHARETISISRILLKI